jgi:hypothetical protein
MNDELPEDDVLTRSQLLQRRGYDGTEEPYGLANGHVQPVCQGCGKELVDRAPGTKWCSQSCRSRHRPDRHIAAAPVAEDDAWSLPALIGLLLDKGAAITFELNGALVFTAALPT